MKIAPSLMDYSIHALSHKNWPFQPFSCNEPKRIFVCMKMHGRLLRLPYLFFIIIEQLSTWNGRSFDCPWINKIRNKLRRSLRSRHFHWLKSIEASKFQNKCCICYEWGLERITVEILTWIATYEITKNRPTIQTEFKRTHSSLFNFNLCKRHTTEMCSSRKLTQIGDPFTMGHNHLIYSTGIHLNFSKEKQQVTFLNAPAYSCAIFFYLKICLIFSCMWHFDRIDGLACVE